MRLVPITIDDEDLAVGLECGPEMMFHIGGARQEADVRASHKRRLALMEKGEAHMYLDMFVAKAMRPTKYTSQNAPNKPFGSIPVK